MPLTSIAILTAAAISAFLHLRARYNGPTWQIYVFKPLTTALLIILAVIGPAAHGSQYQLAIVIGIAFSLIGDVFLMLPGDRFVPGLASFLFAHLAYITAFSSRVQIGTAPELIIPLVIIAVPLLWVLWPNLGSLRLPVLFYMAAILLMVWLAWAFRLKLPSPGSTFAAFGAALFMTSDAILSLNRFRRPFRSAEALIMTTYVAAQALIALSVSTP